MRYKAVVKSKKPAFFHLLGSFTSSALHSFTVLPADSHQILHNFLLPPNLFAYIYLLGHRASTHCYPGSMCEIMWDGKVWFAVLALHVCRVPVQKGTVFKLKWPTLEEQPSSKCLLGFY